jgi:hypothetical protein
LYKGYHCISWLIIRSFFRQTTKYWVKKHQALSLSVPVSNIYIYYLYVYRYSLMQDDVTLHGRNISCFLTRFFFSFFILTVLFAPQTTHKTMFCLNKQRKKNRSIGSSHYLYLVSSTRRFLANHFFFITCLSSNDHSVYYRFS